MNQDQVNWLNKNHLNYTEPLSEYSRIYYYLGTVPVLLREQQTRWFTIHGVDETGTPFIVKDVFYRLLSENRYEQ